MSSRNEEQIETIRGDNAFRSDSGIDEVFNSAGLFPREYIKDRVKDIDFLIAEIDFRDMLIADLKAESTAYERGRNDGIQSLLPMLESCLNELQEHNTDYEYTTQEVFIVQLRTLIESGKNNG